MTEVATSTATTKELSPEEERVLIRDIAITAEANTKEGDSFFLITQKLIPFFLTSILYKNFQFYLTASALCLNSLFPGFFVVNFWNRWWQHWIDYVNQEQQLNTNNNTNEGSSSLAGNSDSPRLTTLKRPSGIDNSDLISDGPSEDSSPGSGIEIHDTLLEGRDYVLLPQQVWNQLYSWLVS